MTAKSLYGSRSYNNMLQYYTVHLKPPAYRSVVGSGGGGGAAAAKAAVQRLPYSRQKLQSQIYIPFATAAAEADIFADVPAHLPSMVGVQPDVVDERRQHNAEADFIASHLLNWWVLFFPSTGNVILLYTAARPLFL